MAKEITYKGDAELYEKVEDVPGEQEMFDLAARIIDDFAHKKLKETKDGISILDLCCGTMPIIRKLLEKYDKNNPPFGYDEITGVDIDENYIEFAKKKLPSVDFGMGSKYYGIDFDLIKDDASKYTHYEKVDLILASSAYHHMDDGTNVVHNPKKLELLNKIHEQLKDDGIVVFCENFIRDYNTDEEYFNATREFYDKRIEQLRAIGINDERIALLERVKQYGLTKEYELKASYRIFKEELEKANFKVILEQKVWPEERFFDDHNVGDYVIVAKKVNK